MNKQRKTSHILNIFQYDETTGAVTLPSTLDLTAPASNDDSTKVPTTAWVRALASSLGYVTLSTDQSITGLKTIVRVGAAVDVLNFKIGTDTLYGLKIAYNQNELVGSGEATWSFASTFNNGSGTGITTTPISFFRGVLVTGQRLLSSSVNANLLDYYGNNPSGRYPVYAYNTGVQQFASSIIVGETVGVVNAATGVIADLPSGVVANFKGRVIGSNAVNSNEFVTLSQLTSGYVNGSGTTNYVSKFTASGSVGNSLIFDNGTNVLIGTTTAPTPVLGVSFPFSVTSSASTRIRIDSTQATPNAGVGLYANGVQKFSFAMFGATSDFTIYNDALLAASILVKGNTNNILIGTSTDNSNKLRVNGTGWFDNTLTATSFVRNGGAATEILAANGSVITAGTGITISGGTISSTVTGGVASFNTRTGAVTLSSGDVTTALGFTPYNATNPSGYITGITSGMVTTALGFTPYNATNPSGYITGITSGMVTTALGYTPYNSSNPSGYITGYTETDTLATVTARGASTASGITFTAPGGTVLLKHAVSEVDAWIFQENAANWGIYWKNNPSGNHTFGGYTTIGAETFGMSAANASGNGVLTSNFVGATSAYAQWMLSNYTGFIWSASTVFAAGDMRAPIFYDSNNTGYYIDGAGTSVLNILNFPSGSSTINTTTPGTSGYQLNFTGQSTSDYAQAITWGWSTSGAQAGIYVQSSGGYGTRMYIATTDSFATGARTAMTINESGIITTTRNYLQAAGSLRAPIFYDSDDTGYYADFNSTSNSAIRLRGGMLVGPNTTWGAYLQVGGNGHVSASYANVVTSNGNLHMDPATSCHMYLNYYVNGIIYLNGATYSISSNGSYYNGRSELVTINYNNDSNSNYQILWGSGNSVYGSAQTYINPSSDDIYSGGYRGSKNVGGTGEASWHPAGIYSGSTQWLYGTTYRNSSSTYGQGWMYFDSNYGYSAVGLYASTRYQGVFAMGDAYKLPADGTSTGSLYGLAWSHPNAGGVAGNLNTHGLLVMEAGGFLAAISGSIRSRDDMRAPIFYDSNNTGYYFDGASTSALYDLTIVGAAHKYLYINPGNGYEAMVRYNGGSGSGWYAGKRTSGGINSTADFHFYAEAAGADVFGITGSSLRAPIFYDSNNTGYYVDSNNRTSLNTLTVNGGTNYFYGITYFETNNGGYSGSTDSAKLQAYSSSNNSAFMSFHKGGVYAVNFGLDVDNVMRIGGWSAAANRWQLDMSGNNWVASSFRAPIFYDSDDTGYYLNPNGLSYLYSLELAGGAYFRPRNWIQFDGNYGLYWPNNYGAHFYPNNYNTYTQFRLDGNKNGYGGIVDSYSAVSGIMYDSGGNGGVYREANSRWYFYYHLGNDCMGVGTSSTSSTYSLYLTKGIYAPSRIDATIYYDASNTAYYLDPNGGSYLAGSVEVANGYFLTNGVGGSIRMSSAAGGFGGYFQFGQHAVIETVVGGYHVYVLSSNGNGVVKYDGAQSWSAHSDRRIKTIHSVMQNNLSKLESIDPIYYSFNNFNDTTNRIGLIAQEVQEHFPELVATDPKTDYLTLDYTGLIPILLGAIKELKNKVEDLESRL